MFRLRIGPEDPQAGKSGAKTAGCGKALPVCAHVQGRRRLIISDGAAE